MKKHSVALALVLGTLGGAGAWAHGGAGVPFLNIDRPGPAQIMDAEGVAELRWIDADPDDDANIAFSFSSDPDVPAQAQALVAGLPEDCDPSDAGPVYTGAADAGGDLTELYCRSYADAGACNPDNDCYAWDVSAVAEGNYFILGVVDDHYPDGGGGNVRFARSRGVVRVRKPGQNVPPAMLVTEPDGVGDLVDTCFRARWVDDDPDDDAIIDLYLKKSFSQQEPVLVAQGLSEDDVENGFDVDISAGEDLADYEVIAEIRDSTHAPWRTRSLGRVTVYRAGAQDGGCVGTPVVWRDG
ncbi:MAG: hypothetical protein AB2A00_38905, partial [Myxococcota bacterium]